MASLVNQFFNQNEWSIEQNLFNGLKSESIQLLGRKYYYLPRDVQQINDILNEDTISSFPLAIQIEMYMSNATGFEGDKEMFSKFGMQISNSYQLVVSKDRWDAEVKTQFDNNSANGEALFDKANYVRPHEGDLIYDPLTKFLMEIKFVDHDAEFYQAGKNYLYHLSCEAYQYASDKIDTGVDDIDLFSDRSQDVIEHQLLTEQNDILIFDSEYILQETDTAQGGTDFVNPSVVIGVTIENPFD
jgi:hypothetical protein